MKTRKTPFLFAAFALAVLIAAPAAFAQIPEYSTLQTNEPLRVGDKVLQPGTYLIRVVPDLATKNQVQVMTQDGKEVLVTALTIPHALPAAEKDQPNTIFVYYPSITGEPKVLRTWYAPDSPTEGGRDFVYDEDFAKRLARATETTVPAYRGTVEAAELEVVTPDQRIEVYTPPAPVVVQTPAPVVEERTMVAGVQTERTELPRTAGNTPLMALAGILVLGAAVGLRILSSRS